ncbi:MAG: homoserine kinase [Planctomycetota bacterium]
MTQRTCAVATAPGSIGNCAVGFDVLGQSLPGPVDRVTVTRTTTGEVRVLAIRGCAKALPLDAERNTAGRALLALREHFPPGTGFDVEIDKGLALSSGMGGSAASAVAAVVAANDLRAESLPLEVLYRAACEGEAAASGAAHGDNVGPSLCGGLVIAPHRGAPVRVTVPDWLHVALVHPHCELETRRSREVLREPYPIADFARQAEGLALVMVGCQTGDRELLHRGLFDVLVEPRRAPLIPGFADVKLAAMTEGAFGASIAGGGPSVFGWFDGREAAERGAAAMREAFAAAGLQSDVLVGPVDGPKAQVIERS